MSHNPFEDTPSNPWSDGGSGQGNAYDTTPPKLPPRIRETPTLAPSSPYHTQQMPSPSAYQPQLPANAWHQHQESTKTLDEPTYGNTNAYQYSGTSYGNLSVSANAYSPQSNHIENTTNPNTSTFIAKPEPHNPSSSGFEETPSNRKALARAVIFVLAVGHLGFSAGASPFSGDDVPFDSKICFYFLFAVAVMSIIWSGYNSILYMFKKFGSAKRVSSFIVVLCDLFMAAMWGIGIFVEMIEFKCPRNEHKGWCDFYNVSIFFGFTSFACYVALLIWHCFKRFRFID